MLLGDQSLYQAWHEFDAKLETHLVRVASLQFISPSDVCFAFVLILLLLLEPDSNGSDWCLSGGADRGVFRVLVGLDENVSDTGSTRFHGDFGGFREELEPPD